MRSLRERIARHYHDTYAVSVPAERICITTGSSGGFILSFLALFDIGARVAISAPGYPAYRNTLQALGLHAVEIETRAQDRWVLTREAIERAHDESALDGVLVMSPANPSRHDDVCREALAALTACCRRLGLWFISDEIYHGLTYEQPAQTALASDPDALVINSFSKYYCMTGWRVGWVVLPERMVRPVEDWPSRCSSRFPCCRKSQPRLRFQRRRSWKRSRGAMPQFAPSSCRSYRDRIAGFPPCRWRLLCLRRRRSLHERFHVALPPYPGRNRSGGDPWGGFRSRPRSSHAAYLLRRHGR